MRVILEFYEGMFLQKKRERINFDENIINTIDQLLQLISQKIHKKEKELKLTFKKDGHILKLIKGWNLNFYGLKENSIILAEILENKEEKALEMSKQINQKYLSKLFQNQHHNITKQQKLSQINEEQIQKYKLSADVDSEGSFIEQDNENDEECDKEEQERIQEQEQYINEQLGDILKMTKNGQLEEIKEFIENDENIPVQFKQGVEERKLYRQKKLELFNEPGSGGWNALHFAIFCNHYDIIKYLIEQNTDLDQITNDGWSALQLAIHKNNKEIVQLIIKTQRVNLNELTIKGTALHIASQLGNIEVMNILLDNGVEVDIRNEQQKTAAQVCYSEEGLKLLNKFQKLNNSSQLLMRDSLNMSKNNSLEQSNHYMNGDIQISGNQNNLSQTMIPKESMKQLNEVQLLCRKNSIFEPPMPPKTIGMVYKIGTLGLSKTERFLVVDVFSGCLLRFKKRAHYPLKPNEVIPLRDIQNVQLTKPNMLMDNDLSYFEVLYEYRLVFACQNEITAKLWVNYIYQAAVYSQFIYKVEQLGGNIKLLHQSLRQENIELKDDNFEDKLIFQKICKFNQEQLEQQKLQQEEQVRLSKDNSTENTNNTQQSLGPKQQSSENKQAWVKKGGSSQCEEGSEKQGSQQLEKQDEPILPNIQKNEEQKPKELINFQSFDIYKILGQGAFGKVFLVKKKNTGKLYAMKALKKRNLILNKQLRFAVTEANVLKQCDHEFVLGLHFAFQTPSYLYLVMDYCPGGDLAQHLIQRTTFDEQSSKFYIAELILAIENIHKKNVIYRDLKPENILLSQDGHIKLADFGLCKENVSKNQQTTTFCGTPAYLSPEMVKDKKSTPMSDIYGIGCCLFEMLTGEPPFYQDDIPSMYKQIQNSTLRYPASVSQIAKDFLKKILEKNPEKRLGYQGFEEIKTHPFFESIDWDKLLKKQISPPVMKLDDENDEEDDLAFFNSNQLNGKPIFKDTDYTESNKRINRVIKFTFNKENNE